MKTAVKTAVKTEMKTIDNITALRNELSSIPRVRLQFAKAITDLLAENNISLSGDFLGQLTLATCHELEARGIENYGSRVTQWTN